MLNASGALNLERGRLEAALADFRGAAEIADASLPPGHEMRVHLYYNVGSLHQQLEQHGAAAEAFERAYLASDGFEQDHPHRLRSLIGLVRAHLAAGQPQAAADWLDRLGQLAEDLGVEHPVALWHEVFGASWPVSRCRIPCMPGLAPARTRN